MTTTEERVNNQTRVTTPARDGAAAQAHDGAAIPAQSRAIPVHGVADISDGRGFLRTAGYRRSPEDIPLTPAQVRQYGLRKGDIVEGTAAPQGRDNSDGGSSRGASNRAASGRGGSNRGTPNRNASNRGANGRGANGRQNSALISVESINGLRPDEARKRPDFEDLTPLYPNERLRLEDGDSSPTARIIDLITPIGKGQRGLIVAPPKAGKTMVLKTIAHAITNGHPEVHLMMVLVGERPEEVTDLSRSVRGEVIFSTFDQSPEDHVRAAELAIERAKRLVELGHDVVVLLDSLTRLGRAYNLAAPASSRTLSGGVAASALQPPRQFLGAARSIEGGGSLTLLSTALIDTGSQLDNVLFEEFKGTGNMELRLRRDFAEKRMFPAIDPVPSSTRREDLLMDPAEHAAVVSLRRALAALDSQRALELLLDKTRQPNAELLRQVQATR
jgi:transcription termination factor Rho